MTYTYTIPEVPPSNNKFIGRTNKWAYQAEKKRWAEIINLFCRPKPDKPVENAIVTLLYHFADKRRRDPDNFSGKMILDGLVKARILVDDSFDNIKLVLVQGESDRNKPRTVIEIKGT